MLIRLLHDEAKGVQPQLRLLSENKLHIFNLHYTTNISDNTAAKYRLSS